MNYLAHCHNIGKVRLECQRTSVSEMELLCHREICCKKQMPGSQRSVFHRDRELFVHPLPVVRVRYDWHFAVLVNPLGRALSLALVGLRCYSDLKKRTRKDETERTGSPWKRIRWPLAMA